MGRRIAEYRRDGARGRLESAQRGRYGGRVRSALRHLLAIVAIGAGLSVIRAVFPTEAEQVVPAAVLLVVVVLGAGLDWWICRSRLLARLERDCARTERALDSEREKDRARLRSLSRRRRR